ncbi:hypothetical protein C1I60_12745 [Paenibacillus terrae]|uniref:Uncharacterized protein n=1 Tax=Paenibacillus terrae TaxID=159743 RepID=A0A4U2Q3G1_9BACL|nr:hypothetical protein [Paenibacillus terrae]TKH44194.1 hypothetical protein C1I60_12745 [Paenibacillus terrae]
MGIVKINGKYVSYNTYDNETVTCRNCDILYMIRTADIKRDWCCPVCGSKLQINFWHKDAEWTVMRMRDYELRKGMMFVIKHRMTSHNILEIKKYTNGTKLHLKGQGSYKIKNDEFYEVC